MNTDTTLHHSPLLPAPYLQNLQLGFVSRVNSKVAVDHTVLATQFFKPKELAMQINLSVINMWGVVKMICDMVMQQEDGKFVLLKDPNKATARLYRVPLHTFEEDEDDDDEEEDDDEEGGRSDGDE